MEGEQARSNQIFCGRNMLSLTKLPQRKSTGFTQVDVHNSGTSNNGDNMPAISMLPNIGTSGEYGLHPERLCISGTSNYGADMRVIPMLHNIDTFGGHVDAVSTLQISGTLDSGEIELAGPTLRNNGTSESNNCVQEPSLGALHSEFQSRFNAVPRYLLSWGHELKCLASLMATKISEVLNLSRNREIVGFLLPSYTQDLGGNTPLEENSLTREPFMCYVRDSFLDIPPNYRMATLGLCCAYLISLMKNTTAPFGKKKQLEKTTNAPPQPLLLTFGETYGGFYDEIYLITTILVCIISCMVLSYPLPAGVKVILFMGLVIIPAFSYLPDLVHKASKTGVVCGSIKLPLFWTTVLGAVVMSVSFGLIALFLFYILWLRSGSGRNPRVEAVDDASLDGFAEAFQE